MFLDANYLYGWAISQKLPVNDFEWVEDLSQFKEDFIKNCDEDRNKGYFLEVDVEYTKIFCHSNLFFIAIFPTFFCSKCFSRLCAPCPRSSLK